VYLRFLLAYASGCDCISHYFQFEPVIHLMPDLTIKDAQQKVDDWINTIGVRYFSELTNLAQLVEEVGEVSRIMSRQYGDQSFKKSDEGADLSDELADVLFVLICIANQTGIDLNEALLRNLEKKTVRDATRHQQNEKLHDTK
jgi:NTP pyrophosphatase (non-canonical NTP hydrolase)